MQSTLILFDLSRSNAQGCWSPNAWKTRLALNYKAIPYTTCWLEFNDIANILDPLRASATNRSGGKSTIPTICLHDLNSNQTKFVTDSKVIAKVIDAMQPYPPLYMEEDCVRELEELCDQLIKLFSPRAIPKVVNNVLNTPSADYERQKWEAWLGMSIEQWYQEKGGEQTWQNVQPIFERTDALLKKTEGPFFLGGTASYADLLFTSILLSLKSIDTDDFDRVITSNTSFKTLFDAISPFSQRSSF